MVVTEFYMTRDDGVDLNRTYSDRGMYIRQNETGYEYTEAIDVTPMRYTYRETDKPIEQPEGMETLKQENQAMEKTLNEMGVVTR